MKHDESFISILSDVVWRFHVYGQYGRQKDRAVKALIKRAPGYPTEHYTAMFEINLEILISTIEAVDSAPKSPRPKQKYSEYSDVDTDHVLSKLRGRFPNQPDELLNSHLGMVIYYYYLR